MDVSQALEILINGDLTLRGEAVGVLVNNLYFTSSDSTICDWLYSGHYQKGDTLQMIQNELSALEIPQKDFDF